MAAVASSRWILYIGGGWGDPPHNVQCFEYLLWVLLFVLYPEKRYINVTNYYLLWLLYVADLLICLNPVSVLYLRNYGLVVHCFRWISHLSVSGLEMELIRYVFLLSDHRSGGFFHGWPSEVFYASVPLRESGEIIESWRHAFSSSQCWLHSVSLPSLNSSSPLPQNPRQSRCKSNRSVQLVVLEVHYQMLQWQRIINTSRN